MSASFSISRLPPSGRYGVRCRHLPGRGRNRLRLRQRYRHLLGHVHNLDDLAYLRHVTSSIAAKIRFLPTSHSDV